MSKAHSPKSQQKKRFLGAHFEKKIKKNRPACNSTTEQSSRLICRNLRHLVWQLVSIKYLIDKDPKTWSLS